ncbi:hypothetical protein L244_18550, partial [Salmonella enterica subsp. enterica serovar Worthington str. BCH-3194]
GHPAAAEPDEQQRHDQQAGGNDNLAGAGAGLLLSLPFIPLAGWVVVPTGLLVMPLLLVWFGGRWMARLKRGKPENWLWQRLETK